MLKIEKMKEEAHKYLIDVDEDSKSVAITKGGNSVWVSITPKRAFAWVEAGVEDLNCKSKEEMLELLKRWLK